MQLLISYFCERIYRLMQFISRQLIWWQITLLSKLKNNYTVVACISVSAGRMGMGILWQLHIFSLNLLYVLNNLFVIETLKFNSYRQMHVMLTSLRSFVYTFEIYYFFHDFWVKRN